MPGKVQPPSVGDRPQKAQQIMSAVYEEKRAEGYPKARAAKMGWGAVKRAGFDPDHFDEEIDALRYVIADLQAKDEYLDEQAERLGLEYDPAFHSNNDAERGGEQIQRNLDDAVEYINEGDTYDEQMSRWGSFTRRMYPSVTKAIEDYLMGTVETKELDPAFIPRRSRIFGGAKRAIRTGRRIAARIPRTTRRPRATTPRPRPSPSARPRTPGYIADPAKLVTPIDIPGYDNLNNVRFVPRDDSPGYYPTRGLVEGQIVLPQHQFLRSLEVIEKNPEYGHVELTDEDGDGYIDRFVVRGPKDETRPKRQNVGLFVDIAKPLKNDRLLMENWVLQ